MENLLFSFKVVLRLVRLATLPISLATSLIAFSQEQKSNPTAPGLDLIAGKWLVEGKMDSQGSTQAMQNKEDCKYTPGYPSVVCDIDTNGNFGHSHGMSVHTFDATVGTYSYSSVTSAGSSEQSSGSMPDASTISWTGTMSIRGHVMTTRLTMRLISQKEETVTLERGAENGTFVVMMQGKRTRLE